MAVARTDGNGFTTYRILQCMSMIALCGMLGGCITLGRPPASLTASPLKVVVGPVILEAPIIKSTQIHSFEEASSPEIDPVLLAQMAEEIQITAQRFLTEHLACHSEIMVVPFDETRRLLADLALLGLRSPRIKSVRLVIRPAPISW